LGVAAAVAAAGWPALAQAEPSSRQCFVDAKTHKPAPTPKSAAERAQVVSVLCHRPGPPAAQTAGLPRLFASADALPLVTKDAALPPPPAWWVSAEGLVMWSKSAPLPPTLTTFVPGSPSGTVGPTNFGGALGVPGTIVLSPSNLNYDPSAGARFTAGHWLDPAHNWAVDVEGFFLGNQSAGFSEASGANGSPALRVPFTNVAPGGAGFPLGSSSFVLADGGFATGSQVIGASLQLWGVEGNAFYHLGQRGPFDVTLLGGLRYLDLREGLSIVSNETLLPGALGAPGSFTATDGFSTRNQFFGAQIGAKAQAQMGRFDGLLLAKVALGDNYETVGVSGSSVVSGFGGVFPAGGGVFPGGIFAQATNIGQQSRSQFAAVPEVQAQLGYRLPFGVRAFVGYDMIFVSNVVRPGNQIDTTLNLSAAPGINPAGAFSGAARPAPMFNNSSFWVQGVNFGASYAF
jgi:Putative beta barrel porin-7 (BBP7)